MKTLTQDQVKNHTGFSIGDEIHLNNVDGTIIKVKDVQFVFKFDKIFTYVDYEWRNTISMVDNVFYENKEFDSKGKPSFKLETGVSIENFRNIVLGK